VAGTPRPTLAEDPQQRIGDRRVPAQNGRSRPRVRAVGVVSARLASAEQLESLAIELDTLADDPESMITLPRLF
jgi:hypothetical protein